MSTPTGVERGNVYECRATLLRNLKSMSIPDEMRPEPRCVFWQSVEPFMGHDNCSGVVPVSCVYFSQEFRAIEV